MNRRRKQRWVAAALGIAGPFGGWFCEGARAEAAIEGTVAVPKAAPPAVTPERYQLKAGDIAPAPPPAAIVYLDGNFPAPTRPPATMQMGQKGFQFTTRVLAVQSGTRVEFPNFDDDYHNVFSYSKTRRFDLGRYRKGETPAALVFDKPGVVRLYCEIHEHMRSVIVVLATPHFQTTGPDGKFRLAALPAGEFTLKAWIDENTVREQRVTLTDGQTLRVDFPAK